MLRAPPPPLETPFFMCFAEKGKPTRASVTITASSPGAVAELFSRRPAKLASPCRNSLAELDALPSAAFSRLQPPSAVSADVPDSTTAAAIAVNTIVA